MAGRIIIVASVLAVVVVFRPAFAAPPAPPAPKAAYKACPPNKVWSEPQDGCICAPGWSWNDAAKSCVTACAAGTAPDAKGACVPDAKSCPVGRQWSDPHGFCVVTCATGKVPDASGVACVTDPNASERKVPAPRPVPKPVPEAKISPAPKSSSGAKMSPSPKGAADPKAPLPRGAAGAKSAPERSCPDGKEWLDAFDGCVPICAANQVLDFHGRACHPIALERRVR